MHNSLSTKSTSDGISGTASGSASDGCRHRTIRARPMDGRFTRTTVWPRLPLPSCDNNARILRKAVEVQPLDRPTYLPPTIGSPNRVNHTVAPMAEAAATSKTNVHRPGGERRSLKGGGVMVHVVYSGRAESE